jgi:enoyl-CoA hydratase
MLSAQRAHAYGLVNRLTEPGQALAVAQELGSAIAANGPLAIATSKQVIVESVDWPTRDMFELQRALTDPVFASADAREGAAAFAEKRKPVWTGK